jgi:hypothetical protein
MLLSGNLFNQQCKWSLDDRYPIRIWGTKFDVAEGDIIFLRHEMIGFFLKNKPFAKVTLIIHNSDQTFTEEDYKRVEPFVNKVYAVNCEAQTAIPIPLGFRDDQYASHDVLWKIRREPQIERTIPVLLNFLIATNPVERGAVFDFFKDKPFCHSDPEYIHMAYEKSLTFADKTVKQKREEFYRSLKRSRFAICPAGNGKDTHRVYECIFFGVIPIVKTSFLDRLYRQLPVWIVNDWSDITAEKVSNYIPIRFEDYPLLKGVLEEPPVKTIPLPKTYLISSLL